jgi:acetyl esterase/lipase
LEDCRAAVRYLRDEAVVLGLDSNRIGAAGFSAGGHLALFLGTTDEPVGGVSARVKAVGSIAGVHDLNEPLTPEGDEYRIVEKLLREPGWPDKIQRAQASPITFIDRASSPAIFLQGAIDPLVPRRQSELAVDRLQAVGVDARMRIVPDMGHAISVDDPFQGEALSEMAEWFAEKLTER